MTNTTRSLAYALTTLAALVAACAYASDSVREVLKGKQQAGQNCSVEKPAATLAIATTRQPEPTLECAIDATQMAAGLASPGAIVVDTRPRQLFDSYHINGAMNLSSSEVKTKTYLKNNSVFLIGAGKRDRELYDVCGELKSAGFPRVRVLRGGMLSWVQEGRATTGTAPTPAQLSLLTPADLSYEAGFSRNLVLLTPEAQGLKKSFPHATIVRDSKTESIAAALSVKKKASSVGAVVLVADEHFDQTSVPTMAMALKPTPLLVYAQAGSAYQHFLDAQKAVWTAQARGPKKPGCSM